MSSSSASVLYGITVNVHDLIRGARAFTKLTRNTIVLDLLLARKKRPTTGVLVPCTSGHRHLSPSSSLSTLPAELLLLIRDHLRHSYIAAEPSYWVKELHWTVYAAINEDWNLARNWRKPWSDELWTWHTEIDSCDRCMNMIYGAGDAFHDGADTTCVRPTCHCNERAVRSPHRPRNPAEVSYRSSFSAGSFSTTAYHSPPRTIPTSHMTPTLASSASPSRCPSPARIRPKRRSPRPRITRRRRATTPFLTKSQTSKYPPISTLPTSRPATTTIASSDVSCRISSLGSRRSREGLRCAGRRKRSRRSRQRWKRTCGRAKRKKGVEGGRRARMVPRMRGRRSLELFSHGGCWCIRRLLFGEWHWLRNDVDLSAREIRQRVAPSEASSMLISCRCLPAPFALQRACFQNARSIGP